MKFKVCTLLMCLGICTVAVAQDAMTMLQKGVDLNVVYNNEADFFIGANTAGFEMGYRRSHHINGFRKGVFEIEGLNKNSAKQIAVTNPNPSYQNAKSYNYGQINDLFIVFIYFYIYFKLIFKLLINYLYYFILFYFINLQII